jgi:hypothetical protein
VRSDATKKLYRICDEPQYIYDNTNASVRLHIASLGIGVNDVHLGHVLSRKCNGPSITIESRQARMSSLQQTTQTYARATANVQDAAGARFLVNDMPITKMCMRRWTRQPGIPPLSTEFDWNCRSRTEMRYVFAPLPTLNVGRFLLANRPQLTATPTAVHS